MGKKAAWNRILLNTLSFLWPFPARCIRREHTATLERVGPPMPVTATPNSAKHRFRAVLNPPPYRQNHPDAHRCKAGASTGTHSDAKTSTSTQGSGSPANIMKVRNGKSLLPGQKTYNKFFFMLRQNLDYSYPGLYTSLTRGNKIWF